MSGMIDGSTDTIEHELQGWVSRGRRYDRAAQDLGLGALFFFSSDIYSL